MNTMFKSPKLSPQRLVTLAMLIALALLLENFPFPLFPNN